MAVIPSVSTKALNDANRNAVMKLQQRLFVAQKELSSGRLADVGATLGARTTETVSLRQDLARLNMTIDTNASVTARLDVTQTGLTGLSSTVEGMIGTLIGVRESETGPAIAADQAKAALISFTATMNTSFAGGFLFGGDNVDVKPLNDYYGTPTQPNKQAVDDAFQSFFGFPQDDPQVASITPSQMQTFINTTFKAMFEEPQWSQNWSDASDTNIKNRISNNEVVETSTNANEAAFRKEAMAYTMIAELGVENMNRETFAVVSNAAVGIMGEAVQDLAVEQAKLGTSENRVATANTRMDAQVDILTEQINGLEGVDPFDAAVRVTSLMTQIEASYSLTTRVQQMTILNYL
jgi:flagellar hook-associated protein 3 FlgL